MCADFNLFTDIVSSLVSTCTVKVLSPGVRMGVDHTVTAVVGSERVSYEHMGGLG